MDQSITTMQTAIPTIRGQFAQLIPANTAALIAFDQIASKAMNPNWNPHARKYIARHAKKAELEYVSSDSEGEDGSGPQPQKRLIWRGAYRLNLDVPPRDPRLGWIIGGGKLVPGDESSDLILTERKRHDDVRGRHAHLAHNYSSGALMLHLADHNLAVVDGKDVRDSITIWSMRTHITFGTLSYKLELDGADDLVHRGRLARYQQDHGLTIYNYPTNLLSTPAESDFIRKDYVIKNPIGHGRTSTIFAGEHIKTGLVVAIRRMTRDRYNAGRIEQEVMISEYLGKHDRLCSVVDKMSPDGDRRSAHFRNFAIDEVYLVCSPLAIATWLVLCNPGSIDDQHNEICTTLFWQCVEGIEYIHSKGVMHRDIRPANLMIVSDNPLQGRITGFGSAEKNTNSNTIEGRYTHYHAPEMWSLWRKGEAKTSVPGYDEKVDIFALGLSGYRIFGRQPLWWTEANQGALARMKAELATQGNSPLPVKGLITSMIAEEAKLRPSAKDAGKSKVIPQAPTQRKRKR